MLGIKHQTMFPKSNQTGIKDTNREGKQLGIKSTYTVNMEKLTNGSRTVKPDGFDHENLYASHPKYKYAQILKKKPYLVEKSNTRGYIR